MPKGGSRINAGRKIKLDEKLEFTKRLTKTENDFILFARDKKIDLAKLKKTLLVLAALFLICMPANSYTLKGGVEYTVDKARIIAFDNVPERIDKNEFNSHIKDNFYHSSIAFLEGRISGVLLRKVVPFYNKKNKLSFYGIQYDNEPAKKYYYSTKGYLLKYEINTFKGEYPYKTMAYDTQGKLLNINLVVSDHESFLFDKNKKLIGHWLNNQFYNAKGEKDITRRL